MARWGNGQILDVRYSPDGKILAVSTTASQRIFDGATLDELPFSAELWQTAFPINEASPEVKRTKKGHEVWKQGAFVANVEESEKTALFSEPYAFSADSTLLAASVGGNQVGIWNATSGKLLIVLVPKLEETDDTFFCGDVYSLAFSDDKEFLAVGCYEQGGVFVWEIATGIQISKFSSDSYFVTGIAFSPNKLFLTGSVLGGDVCLWKLPDGILLHCFPIQTASYYIAGLKLAFSPSGKSLVVAFSNGEIKVWDIRNQTLNLRKNLTSSSPSGNAIAFSPDSKQMAVAAYYDVITWDIATGSSVNYSKRFSTHKLASIDKSSEQLSGSRNYIEFVAFTPDGSGLIFVRDVNGLVYRALRPNVNSEFVEMVSGLVAFDSSSKPFTLNNLSELQNPDLQLLMNLDAPNWSSYAISPDRQLIAGAGYDRAATNTLSVQSINDNRRIFWRRDVLHPTGLTFSPEGSHLAFDSYRSVEVWRVSDWVLDYKLSINPEINLYAPNYSLNGEILATAGNDGKIYLWEARSGRFLRTLENHTEAIGDLAFSPNGKLLASTSSDGTMRLWGIP